MRKPKGVPRDEWLLAIGLAEADFWRPVGSWRIAECIATLGDGTGMFPDVQCGAYDVMYASTSLLPPGNPDAYAAGAALAMALEEL